MVPPLTPPPTEQLPTDLPSPKIHLTGHDPSTGHPTIIASRSPFWTHHDDDRLGMAIAYTTRYHPELTDNLDVKEHDARMHAALDAFFAGDGKTGGEDGREGAAATAAAAGAAPGKKKAMGLVNPGGTLIRIVDFAPGYECMMHRTVSVDYGIVVEGEITSVLGPGEGGTEGVKKRLRRGDIMVQRATMHAWRNESQTEWARMVFVLQDCEAPVVKGKRLEEDLGRGTDGVPPSGNDRAARDTSGRL